jgi:hypothetical protein
MHETHDRQNDEGGMNGQAGKGDAYRKVDPKKYAEGWERIYGKPVRWHCEGNTGQCKNSDCSTCKYGVKG